MSVHVFKFPFAEGSIVEGALPAVTIRDNHGVTTDDELAAVLVAKHGAVAVKSDDLTTIAGIGPALAIQLADNGVWTRKQLGAANAEELALRLSPASTEQVRAWQGEVERIEREAETERALARELSARGKARTSAAKEEEG
jgi:hypothetical protein